MAATVTRITGTMDGNRKPIDLSFKRAELIEDRGVVLEYRIWTFDQESHKWVITEPWRKIVPPIK